MAGGRLREARVVGASSRAELAADEGSGTALKHNWLVLHQNLQKLFAFLAGPRAGLWLVWGRGLGAQGNRSPDLHPEAIFPGSFLPHSGSLPWSWIRPFQPSHSGSAWSELLCLEYHRADSAADVPSHQAWLHLPAARETTEAGGLKWPEFEPLAVSSILELKVTVQGKGATLSACPHVLAWWLTSCLPCMSQ